MIKTYKPTSAGIRFRKTLVKDVAKIRPEKSLTNSSIKGTSGRSHGRISTRHRQQGCKKLYRVIDFKRNKLNIEAKVNSIENDPNRGPNIALLHYIDGEKRYILAPEGLIAGMKVISGETVEPILGNAMPLMNVPMGMQVHNIELTPGAGGAMVRGAGGYAQVMAKEGKYVTLKLPSGELKKVLGVCYATIGMLSNMDLRNTQLGKAGRKRHLGWRPSVRGVAMSDPSDHPHAGPYHGNGVGRLAPQSPWGWKTLGVKTRKRSHTNYTIVKSRHASKKGK